MPKGAGYREYAEECLRPAQTATPVRRAHLLRVAGAWLDVAERTDQSTELAVTPDEEHREKIVTADLVPLGSVHRTKPERLLRKPR